MTGSETTKIQCSICAIETLSRQRDKCQIKDGKNYFGDQEGNTGDVARYLAFEELVRAYQEDKMSEGHPRKEELCM